MNKKRDKRGQMEMSFGMIFSIILIVIFIAFAVYAILKFIETQRTTQVASFLNDFQIDIDKMWQSSGGSQESNYNIPSNIEYVCLIDYESRANNQENIYNELKQNYNGKKNIFFYPLNSGKGFEKEIKNIDIKKTTDSKNPFCIKSTKGKIKLTIKKDFGEALVTISI